MSLTLKEKTSAQAATPDNGKVTFFSNVGRFFVKRPDGTTEQIGGRFMGAWAASTAYIAGDFVLRRNSLWRRNADGTSGTTFDNANWTLVAAGLNNRGAWAALTAYDVNDFFTQGGSTYLVTTAFTSGASFDATNTLMLAAGANISDDATLGGNSPSTTAGVSQRVAKLIRDAMPSLHRPRIVENQLTWSEDLTNAAWNKVRSTATGNVGIAPDGYSTACRVTEDNTSGTHGVSNGSVSMVAGNVLNMSVYVKNETRRYVMLLPSSSSPFSGTFPSVVVDLVTGQVVSVNNNATSFTVTALPNGWFRISVTVTATSTGSTGVSVLLHNGTTNVYTGDNSSSLQIWGAQLSRNDLPVEYVRTTSLIVQTVVTQPDQRHILNLGFSGNLLLHSEDFTNANWPQTAMSVAPSSDTPPTGFTNVHRLIPSTANSDHLIGQPVEVVAGQVYAFSVIAKAFGYNWLRLATPSAQFSVAGIAYFDLSTGTVGTTSGVDRAFMTDLGGGWYRCTIIDAATFSGVSVAGTLSIRSGTTDNFATSFAGDGTNGALLAAAQVNMGSFVLPYIRTFGQPVLNPRLRELANKQDVGRPRLIENMATWSEDFTQSAWAKNRVTLTANAAVAPDGNTTATRVTEDNQTGTHSVSRSGIPISVGKSYTASAYVKAETRTMIELGVSGSSGPMGGVGVRVDLLTGQVLQSSIATTNVSVTPLPDGWWRISATGFCTTAGNVGPSVGAWTGGSGGTSSFTGDGVSSFLVWGLQFNEGPDALEYTRTDANAVSRTTFQVKNDTTFTSPSPVLPVSESVAKWLNDNKRNAVNGVSTVTTAFQLATTDVGNTILVNSASNVVCTIPTNATAAIPVGGMIRLIQQGAGLITFSTTGITVLTTLSPVQSSAAGSVMVLEKVATNTWVISRI